ncbi:MAG: IS110 family transposase [Candidatus Dormibacteraceae bacterium]
MMIIGCDFHPRFQQIAYVDTETGEYVERRLMHTAEAESFYGSLTGRRVRVGVEATGNLAWFRRLLNELGQELVLGDATAIRASNPRKQKTDKRDARHILTLLMEDRFPAVWQPGLANERLRQLLLHRSSLVRMRTRVENQLDSLGKNEGLVSSRRWTGKRRREVEGLALTGWYAERRRDLLALLDELEERIGPLEKSVRAAADGDPQASLLMTHPGVGPVVSLAYVLTIGDWQRFPRGKQVASYLGLIPSEESSGNTRRLGHITKQGSPMVRWLLVQAATIAQRYDAHWHRQYVRLSMQKHHGVAKLAIAHKLAVRLYWMLRSGQDYEQIVERGSHAGQSECPNGCGLRPRT